MFSVATTRFNSMTWEENTEWRRRKGHTGCVYGVMKPITATTIPLESYLFVLEMNNQTKRADHPLRDLDVELRVARACEGVYKTKKVRL